jgi:hypothetical protein
MVLYGTRLEKYRMANNPPIEKYSLARESPPNHIETIRPHRRVALGTTMTTNWPSHKDHSPANTVDNHVILTRAGLMG